MAAKCTCTIDRVCFLTGALTVEIAVLSVKYKRDSDELEATLKNVLHLQPLLVQVTEPFLRYEVVLQVGICLDQAAAIHGFQYQMEFW